MTSLRTGSAAWKWPVDRAMPEARRSRGTGGTLGAVGLSALEGAVGLSALEGALGLVPRDDCSKVYSRLHPCLGAPEANTGLINVGRNNVPNVALARRK